MMVLVFGLACQIASILNCSGCSSVKSGGCVLGGEAVRRYEIELICPNGYDCTVDAVAAGLWTGCPLVPTYGGMFTLPYPHPRLPIVNAFSFEQMADLRERYGWEPDTFRNIIARIDGARFSPRVSGDRIRRELGIGSDQPVLVTICRHDRLKLGGLLSLLDG